MSAISPTPHLRRSAILMVTAVTALSAAACGPSKSPGNENTGKPTSSARPTTSPSTPAPPPNEGIGNVEGMVSSVSGNTIHLRLRTGTATVNFSPSTTVTEVSPAQLTDVTVGSCADVEPTPETAQGAGGLTAQSVTISPAVDGNCAPPPAAASTPASPGAPAEGSGVYGMVGSVSGNTITLTTAGGKTPPTNVTVTNTTTYVKQLPSNTQAITQGKCLAAQGPDDGGVVQATTIELQACPPMGRPHRHIPLPHLPHH
ncbi:hypothetical protein [uncultured Mycobacterium sp.]|uniref:hypothetical protein n=1 Tax=uncultured Mycobacterium sp. TaxID=171292 RepID=UPI0035C9F6F4